MFSKLIILCILYLDGGMGKTFNVNDHHVYLFLHGLESEHTISFPVFLCLQLTVPGQVLNQLLPPVFLALTGVQPQLILYLFCMSLLGFYSGFISFTATDKLHPLVWMNSLSVTVNILYWLFTEHLRARQVTFHLKYTAARSLSVRLPVASYRCTTPTQTNRHLYL